MMYIHDGVNQTASATGMGFTWDDGSDDWAYGYDSGNRLINVERNGVASVRYTYDADGRRVRPWDAAGTTDYVYSGLSVVDEVRGGVHEKHVYAGSMHLASVSSGTVEYYHVDHLGSTRLKTDASGGVIYSSNYEPYGPEYGESGSEEFRYTGKQEDPTGLYYFGARYYDPVTGRFTTQDIVSGDLTYPQSLNGYVYCYNNPQKYVDPDGRFGEIAFARGIAEGSTAVIKYEATRNPRMAYNYYQWELRRIEVKEFTRGFVKGIGDEAMIYAAASGCPQIVAAGIATKMIFESIGDVTAAGIAMGYDVLTEGPTSPEVHKIEIIKESSSIFFGIPDTIKERIVDPFILFFAPQLYVPFNDVYENTKQSLINRAFEYVLGTDNYYNEVERRRP